MKVVIIDGYVDEPAHFGVPPYISAYSRYSFGAAKLAGHEVVYRTADQARASGVPGGDILIAIGGVTVPGNYMGGLPMTVGEALEFAKRSPASLKILIGSMAPYIVERSGGIVARANDLEGYDHRLWKDYEKELYRILTGHIWGGERYSLVKKLSVAGADAVRQHPNFPDLMCEIELGMGCERKVHCSFCTEPLWGDAVSRPTEDVLEEIGSLYGAGAVHFRLGRISNIFAYMGSEKPDPFAIKTLYEGIRRIAPNLKTLHTDNANPGYMYSHMDETVKILEIITKNDTPGDILSMGVESFDPKVIAKNNLKINKENFIEIVKMVNSIGGKRTEGVPRLLPGVNLLYGLPGESPATYRINLETLMELLDADLMVRRVNVRKAMAFSGTPLFEMLKGKKPKIDDRLYRHHKFVLRRDFDHRMLQKVFPRGTVLRDVIIERFEGNLSYGRQLGTYPILVGIPKALPIGEHVDCVVADHGQRSLTALPIPVKINSEGQSLLKWIPGIGKSTLSKIVIERPYVDLGDFKERTGTDFPQWLNGKVNFEQE